MMKAANDSTRDERSGMNGKLMAALGLVLGVAFLPAKAQTVPADRLCTAGFNADYGWFDVPAIDRFGVLEFPGLLTQGACVPITPARLAVQLGGTTLPLSGEATYSNIGSATPTLTVPLLEPALCEDYYSASGTAVWNLIIRDANDQDTIGPVVGITALDYNLNSGALVPQRADASMPWLTCYAGLAPNAAGSVEPDENALFADGLESESNLRVTFLDAQGNPLASDVLNQAQAAGSNVSFMVRVSNEGTTAAQDVRIREFVPTTSALMGPTVNRVACVDHGPVGGGSGACSNSGGNGSGIGANRFAQNIGTLAPGAHRDYTLTRRSNSSDVSVGQSMALIQVAAFSAPDASTEVDRADNSRSLRIKVVQNFSPTADNKVATTAEDTPVGIVLSGSDPEGDPLTFQVASGPSHGALTGTAPNLTYTPAADYFGADSFTYTANDGTTSSAPATVLITVTPVNDGPRVANQLPDVEYDEGDEVWISLAGAFMDPESDPFSVSVSATLPSGVVYNSAGNVILSTGPLGSTTAGIYTITLTATEVGTLLTATQQFTLTVHNVNQDPIGSNTPLQDRTDDEGDAISFSVAAAFDDPDPDDVLTFSLTGGSLPPGIALAANGAMSGTIGQTAATGSPYAITITADDQQGGTVTDSFVWTVNAVNVSPVVTGSLSDRVWPVGVPLEILGSELHAAFSDPDGDALTITVSGLPTGLFYFSSTSNISGAPAAGTEGDHLITVTATDPGSLSASLQFTITVQ